MLTERDHLTMQLEGVRFTYPAMKQRKVRELFGESEWRYAMRVDALIERAEAVERYPLTCRRLVRLREMRRAART